MVVLDGGDDMKPTILITGINGFIGNVLVRMMLKLDYKIIGFDNLSGRNSDGLIELCENPNFEFIRGNILDIKQLEKIKNKCSIVIHLAAAVGEPYSKAHEDFTWMVNLKGTQNIADVFNEHQIIFSSTGSVYGKSKNKVNENSPCNPLSVYGLSKLRAEEYLLEKRDCVIYRFATAYGLSPSLRLDLLPNDFVYQAIKNRSITIFQADFRRTFANVKDIARAICFATANFESMKNEIFNVGDPNGNWSKRKLAEFIREKTNCTIFYGDEEKNPFFDGDFRDYDSSYEKINKIGFFTEISMEKGITDLIKAISLVNIQNQYIQRI